MAGLKTPMGPGPIMDRRATTPGRDGRQGDAARTEKGDRTKAPGKDFFRHTLLVRHPTADLDTLSSSLGLKPYRTWNKGAVITTPTGRTLSGTYQHSMWTHVWRIRRPASVASTLSKVLDQLAPCGRSLKQIRADGGDAQIILRTTGDRHLGDTIGIDTLRRLAEIGLDFGIEVFPFAAAE